MDSRCVVFEGEGEGVLVVLVVLAVAVDDDDADDDDDDAPFVVADIGVGSNAAVNGDVDGVEGEGSNEEGKEEGRGG
jgi:hypothetical protein